MNCSKMYFDKRQERLLLISMVLSVPLLFLFYHVVFIGSGQRDWDNPAWFWLYASIFLITVVMIAIDIAILWMQSKGRGQKLFATTPENKQMINQFQGNIAGLVCILIASIHAGSGYRYADHIQYMLMALACFLSTPPIYLFIERCREKKKNAS